MGSVDVFSGLNELLGVDPKEGDATKKDVVLPVFEAPVPFKMGTPKEGTGQTETDDFNFARKTLHTAIEKAQELMMATLYEAKMSGHPKSFEVAANSIKILSDMTKDLLVLHQQAKNLAVKENDPNANPTKEVLVVETTTLDMLRRLDRTKIDESIIEGEVIKEEHGSSDSSTESS